MTAVFVKYQRLAQDLRQAITGGRLQPGEGLPPERDLAKSHGVSRPTVRAALDALAHEGLLCREQGRGTFVARGSGSAPVAALTLVYSAPTKVGIDHDPYLAGLTAQVAMRSSVVGSGGPMGVRVLTVPIGVDAGRVIEAAGGISHCRGGVLFVGQEPPSDALLVRLRNAGAPCVVLGRLGGREPAATVAGDGVRTGELAARHLLAHGHRRLALVDGPWMHHPCVQRRDGFLAAVAAAGAEAVVVDAIGWDRPATAAAVRAAFAGADRPTAAAVFGDCGVAGLLDAARDLGLAVPRDLAVVAMHLPEPLAPLAEVPLTALVVPYAGYVQAVLEALRRPAGELPSQVLVADRLVVGRSCGCVVPEG
jgi:GntR family transcriptional regulator of arabinose operon